MPIAENIRKIKETIPQNVKLVAVSKTYPVADILEAYRAGQYFFGENKVQEIDSKQAALPKDTEWHFIGHLQTNKVRFLAPFVSLIHGADSLKLLKTIDKEAAKINREIACLLQFHIAEEDTKFGLSYDEAAEMLESPDFLTLQHAKVCGVMGMATFTDDFRRVRDEFRRLRNIFEQLRSNCFSGDHSFKEVSMGMSDDYKIAIDEGSTIVRIGSSIFGKRK
ncbi:MAG: YggS family pyridoxal phosphate-dependent enzyme [Prolixibacteraceae bacterium]|nr:YggS family pyridoxal phosphate-dependent enzyme [Prolixibacteraceae bacterium]